MRSALLICALATSGCAGARTNLLFDGLRHPVSFSPVLQAGRVPAEDAHRGSFERVVRAYSLFYGLIPLDPNTDLAPLLEEEIARLQGNAVVDLKVTASSCAANYAYPMPLLPVWPSCVHLRVTGTVVEVKPSLVAFP